MTDLSNKTALVTGASRGIGRATALALAAAGARVIVQAKPNLDGTRFMSTMLPIHLIAGPPLCRGDASGWHRGRAAGMWVSAGVVAHTLWTSAAPAMVYPLYAAGWSLSHTTTTAIFAIYPVTVVAVLIGAGDVSDHIGRRGAMLLGLAASLSGVLVFALAQNVSWLFVGRALMGVGVGLSAGPSTAAVIEFSLPGQFGRASALTTVAQAAGFASALLIGGALIEYAPFPTRLSFWVLSAVIVTLLVATWLLPDDHPQAPGRWRPRLPMIAPTLRGPFAL